MINFLMPRAWGGYSAGNDVGWTGSVMRTKTRAGVTVDEEVALTYEAVFAALRVLAEGVGGIPPLPKYERKGEQNRVMVDGMFDYMANPMTTAGVFREGRVAHQVGWGNGFAEIERDAMGKPIAMWPIHPSRVERANADSEYSYVVRSNNGEQVPLYDYEVLHLPGALSDDGIWGRGVLTYGRETIGGGIGTARASYANLGSGGQPKGVLEVRGLGGAEARAKRAAFREEWNEVHGNPETNSPTIAIVEMGGAKYTPLSSLSPESNQVIQMMAYNKSAIATLFGIPGYKIGAEGKETAGTIEQKAIEFVVYSLLPWARKWEEQCGFKLLSEDERKQFYYEHNFTALLRGDVQARYNAYRIALGSGIMSINEVRRLENLPNIGPDGDMHLVPANLVTVDRMASGDVGGGGRLGSEASGLPNDDPNDQQALARFGYTKHRLVAEEMTKQLTDLRAELPERKVEWMEVARESLTDVLHRMLTKEADHIGRAAKSNEFPTWLREFYAKHYLLLCTALKPTCGILRIAGVKRWERAEDLAAWLKAKGMDAAQNSWDNDTPTVMARKLEKWPTERAAWLAEEVLKG